MRIFGSTAHIAVQVELLEPAGEFPVCHICLWADGMRIGDYQQTVLLSPIADFFRSTIGSHDRRIDDELGGLSPEQIVAAVKTVLFDDAGSELPYDETRLRRLERYRKLCICPNGCEAFDGELAVLIEREAGESFIWQDFTDKRVRELRLAQGDYEAVVRMFLAWADPLTGHDPSTEHFAGKTFVIAGKFSRPQSDIVRVIRRLGGRVDRAVSERTSYVLAGQLMPQAARKIQQARTLNVPVLSEAEFDSLLPSGPNEFQQS